MNIYKIWRSYYQNNLIDFRDNQYELSKTDNTINKDHHDMHFYKDKGFLHFYLNNYYQFMFPINSI